MNVHLLLGVNNSLLNSLRVSINFLRTLFGDVVFLLVATLAFSARVVRSVRVSACGGSFVISRAMIARLAHHLNIKRSV